MWQVSMSDVRDTDLFFSRGYGNKPIGVVGCRSVMNGKGRRGRVRRGKREEGRWMLGIAGGEL